MITAIVILAGVLAVLLALGFVLFMGISYLECRARAECAKQQLILRLAVQDVGLELIRDSKWLRGVDDRACDLLHSVGKNLVAKGHSDIAKITRGRALS